MTARPGGTLVYRGIWAVLARWFQVPERPPDPPRGPNASIFRPADAFLRYLRLSAWLRTLLLVAVATAFSAVFIAELTGVAGLAISGILMTLAVLYAVVDHSAVRLRFDTTWYVMTDRSLRIRRGIWTIREMTVTFDNVQNVRVRQGPLQRWLGIADVVVETAATGVTSGSQQEATASSAKVEGVADAVAIRDRIAVRMGASRGAGLGDDEEESGPRSPAAGRWSPAHLEALREVRDEVRRLESKRGR